MYRGPWREGRLWAGLGLQGPGLPRRAESSSERVKEPRAGTGEAGSSATCSLSGSANSSMLGQDLCPQVPKSPGSRSRASEQQGPAPLIRGRLAREGQRPPGPEQGSGGVLSFLGHDAARPPLPAGAPGAEALARLAGQAECPSHLATA